MISRRWPSSRPGASPRRSEVPVCYPAHGPAHGLRDAINDCMDSMTRYHDAMAAQSSITIRKLDPQIKRRLRRRASENGRSMEAEAREILRTALAIEPNSGQNLIASIRARFSSAGFVDLELPAREGVAEGTKL